MEHERTYADAEVSINFCSYPLLPQQDIRAFPGSLFKTKIKSNYM